jgi:hypothetical protein
LIEEVAVVLVVFLYPRPHVFLRAQGACVMSIKPEYLMEPQVYKHWAQLQKDIEAKKNKTGRRDIRVKTEDEEALEEQLFEAVSKRAWTDVLLQLLKVQK